MAGIYIHIPFCKQKCHYCDFHFSTTFEVYYEDMISSLLNEIEHRKEYLNQEKVETLYFGGGTPSILEIGDVKRLKEACFKDFAIDKLREFTFELNPDDCSREYLQGLKDLGVDRLSIGIQSFDDQVLKFMNRAHNHSQSSECVEIAKSIGFEKISIDLIYGVPDVPDDYWSKTINQAKGLGVEHVSAYCLTIEQNTVFDSWRSKGKLVMMDEEQELSQFNLLNKELASIGVQRYEVSNFAKVGAESVHNSSYWSGEKYIGIGPSAHSFDGKSRQWNIANNSRYIKSKGLDFEKEQLTDSDVFNEKLLTGLRTVKGVSLYELNPSEEWSNLLDKELEKGRVVLIGSDIMIPEKFLFQADGIAASLFI